MYPYEVDPKDTVYFMLMFSHEWSMKHGLANRKRDKRGSETYVMCKSKCLKKSIGASLLFHIDSRPFSCCSIVPDELDIRIYPERDSWNSFSPSV